MPRGAMPVRVRRRQSDAKWRSSVAMCYNIMKNVVPNHKKLGRRQLSKALTLKETERHIVSLERMIRELIEEKAPVCGKLVMVEKQDGCLCPASFEEIKHDFAEKQLSFFSDGTSSGRKRYNVPAAIETSLETWSQQSCSLVTVNKSDVELTFPELLRDIGMEKEHKQAVASLTDDNLLTFNDLDLPVTKQQETPMKKKVKSRGETNLKKRKPQKMITMATKPTSTPSKVSKQTPFSSYMTPNKSAAVHYQPIIIEPSTRKSSASKPVAMPMRMQRVNGVKVPKVQSLKAQTSKAKTPTAQTPKAQTLKARTPKAPILKTEQIGQPQVAILTPKAKNSQNKTGQHTSPGFTPVKLPCGVYDGQDPVLSLLGTPSMSVFGSPFSSLSMPDTPGSGYFGGVDMLELTDDDDTTSLLCTESIDNVDLEFHDNREEKSKNIIMTQPGSRCRRRLDKLYEDEDQKVPTIDKSCQDLDGFLPIQQQTSPPVYSDPCLAEPSLSHLWELIEPEHALYDHMTSGDDHGNQEHALYDHMTSADDHSNQEHALFDYATTVDDHGSHLSADLMGIDLNPLHKDRQDLTDNTQEVPSLTFDLEPSGLHCDLEYSMVPGYEDLGVFYRESMGKQDPHLGEHAGVWEDEGSQVVPGM